MKRLAVLPIAAVLASPSSAATGKFSQGNTYYAECVASVEMSAFCLGYLMGMSDAPVQNTGTTIDDAIYCPPSGGTYQQTRDVLHKFMRDNPRLRGVGTQMQFMMAMNEAFPCKNSPRITADVATGGVFISKPAPRKP